MGCNCKSDNQYSVDSDIKLNKKIGNYTLRFIVFTLSLLLTPIFIGVMVFFLFRTIVLNKNFDVQKTISSLIEKFKNSDKDDDDDDDDSYEEFNQDELELMDVEYIKNKIKEFK